MGVILQRDHKEILLVMIRTPIVEVYLAPPCLLGNPWAAQEELPRHTAAVGFFVQGCYGVTK